MTENLIELGKTGIEISPLGIGTMQWGDIEFTDQTGSNLDHDIRGVYQIGLDSGINFYDTAEVYGDGKSELFWVNISKNYPTMSLLPQNLCLTHGVYKKVSCGQLCSAV